MLKIYFSQYSKLKLISDTVLGRKYHLTISEYSNTHLNWVKSDKITSSEAYCLKFYQASNRSELLEVLIADKYSLEANSADFKQQQKI